MVHCVSLLVLSTLSSGEHSGPWTSCFKFQFSVGQVGLHNHFTRNTPLSSQNKVAVALTAENCILNFLGLRELEDLCTFVSSQYIWIASYEPHQAEKCFRACTKCPNSQYLTRAQSHSGICFLLKHSVVSNDSVCGQLRP